MRASDNERLYQCLTCKYTEICTYDETVEDERGLCTKYEPLGGGNEKQH